MPRHRRRRDGKHARDRGEEESHNVYGRIMYNRDMRKTTRQDRKNIIKLYIEAETTTEKIAQQFGISSRQVCRIAKEAGVIRTQAESARAMAHLKNYKRNKLGHKRIQLSTALRYRLIAEHPYCEICGARAGADRRLEVDHRDGDRANNSLDNLRVLCDLCNKGSYWLKRENGELDKFKSLRHYATGVELAKADGICYI